MGRAFWVFEGPNLINTIHRADCVWLNVAAKVHPNWMGFSRRETAAAHALMNGKRSAWNCTLCGGVSV